MEGLAGVKLGLTNAIEIALAAGDGVECALDIEEAGYHVQCGGALLLEECEVLDQVCPRAGIGEVKALTGGRCADALLKLHPPMRCGASSYDGRVRLLNLRRDLGERDDVFLRHDVHEVASPGG